MGHFVARVSLWLIVVAAMVVSNRGAHWRAWGSVLGEAVAADGGMRGVVEEGPEFVMGRFVPPAGTASCVWWEGRDREGMLREVGAFDCFESVNYLLGGDPEETAYRSWPREELADLDREQTWRALEGSLRVGDVVEFEGTVIHGDGVARRSVFHAHVCAGPGGLMVGANNTPAFEVVHGVPTIVRKWDVCRSEEYYGALRGMDKVWAGLGCLVEYRVVVYRRP
jgi:hypothetical protein